MVDNTGQVRYLGNNPAPLRLQWKRYGAVPTQPLIPRSEWKGLIDKMGTGPEAWWLSEVHDQNGYGMCNASATASAIEAQRNRQGLDNVQLSAGDLYNRISGGRDQGSTLEDGIAEAMSDGIASVKTVPYLDWQRSGGEKARIERASYRVLEAYLFPSFEHYMSGLLSGFDGISGVLWYPNFVPGSDGWLPSRGRGSAGGHAVHGYKPTYKGDQFGIWHKNSWTKNWGLNGFCVFPESIYGGMGDAEWGIRSVVFEGATLPNPR